MALASTENCEVVPALTMGGSISARPPPECPRGEDYRRISPTLI